MLMPEQLLNRAEIGASIEQVCRERVAQRMWVDAPRQPCSTGPEPQATPHIRALQSPTRLRKEERRLIDAVG